MYTRLRPPNLLNLILLRKRLGDIRNVWTIDMSCEQRTYAMTGDSLNRLRRAKRKRNATESGETDHPAWASITETTPVGVSRQSDRPLLSGLGGCPDDSCSDTPTRACASSMRAHAAQSAGESRPGQSPPRRTQLRAPTCSDRHGSCASRCMQRRAAIRETEGSDQSQPGSRGSCHGAPVVMHRDQCARVQWPSMAILVEKVAARVRTRVEHAYP